MEEWSPVLYCKEGNSEGVARKGKEGMSQDTLKLCVLYCVERKSEVLQGRGGEEISQDTVEFCVVL